MASFKATIKDPVGLHARPASVTVAAAAKFQSDIKITSNGKSGNLKSIMNVMALGIKQNDEITISAEGEDAAKAIETIKEAMKKNALI